MNLDQRLHHAARELRELRIEPPPLGSAAMPTARSTPLRRVPALVAPMLFVLGGLVVVAGGLRPDTVRFEQPMPSPTTVLSPAPDTDVAEGDNTPAGRTSVGRTPVGSAPVGTTPAEELRMIAELVAEVDPALAPSVDPVDPGDPPPIVRPGPIGAV